MQMLSYSLRALSVGATLLAIGLLAGCASPTRQSKVRVVEEKEYIPLNHVQDTSPTSSRKKGDSPAMACGKCKTVWYQSSASALRPFFSPPPLRRGVAGDANWQQGWAFSDWSRHHYCPGCKSTITTTGRGKERKESINHTCEECGDDSLFCCATKPGALPTAGMEPKK